MKREQHGCCRGFILQSVVYKGSKATNLILNSLVSQCAMPAMLWVWLIQEGGWNNWRRILLHLEE